MAREFTPSASQERAIVLFGLTFDGTHEARPQFVEAGGLLWETDN